MCLSREYVKQQRRGARRPPVRPVEGVMLQCGSDFRSCSADSLLPGSFEESLMLEAVRGEFHGQFVSRKCLVWVFV